MTAVDLAIEDTLRGTLGDAFGLPVIGEERGDDAPSDGSAYWLIDPLCGTRNFASGIPLYCVNVSLVERDQVAIAVVGDPSSGCIAIAERGRGAWSLTNDVLRPLRASDASQALSSRT